LVGWREADLVSRNRLLFLYNSIKNGLCALSLTLVGSGVQVGVHDGSVEANESRHLIICVREITDGFVHGPLSRSNTYTTHSSIRLII
jgi:hypothetical protein